VPIARGCWTKVIENELNGQEIFRLVGDCGACLRGRGGDIPSRYAAGPRNMVRGPYGDGAGAMPHETMKSEYHASGNLCATCHNISNPTQAEDVKKQPPHAFGHIERTYSEWALSDFAGRGREGSCQSCHYKPVEGGGQASKFGSLHRDHFVGHGPVGGSTWVQEATWILWDGEDMDRKALDAAVLSAGAAG